MSEHEKEMQETIRKLFQYDLNLLKEKIPENGIWGVCEIKNTGYHGAIRIIPSRFGSKEYVLWVDVFQTIYDPIFSNSLAKGTLADMRAWLSDQDHVPEVYKCMHHLRMLAEDD